MTGDEKEECLHIDPDDILLPHHKPKPLWEVLDRALQTDSQEKFNRIIRENLTVGQLRRVLDMLEDENDYTR